MEEYLNKGIKEVIIAFPGVEEILDEYGIGCGPCSVGVCLLKDIVDIHNLPGDQEREMMAKIANVIYSDKPMEIPRHKKRADRKPAGLSYSPPMQKLVDEHRLIKRWAALIPDVVRTLDLESKEGRELILNGVDFIRSYADKFHHAKEEDILFQYFDEDAGILKVMYEDHTKARGHAKAILEALDRKDKKAVAEHLSAYAALLTEHIRKEDEILYPWMDRNLSISQVGALFARFGETDARMGAEPEKHEAFINELEKNLKQ